jgi:hypothetical protein
VGDLGADQAGQERIKLFAAGQTLAGDLVEAGAHYRVRKARQFDRFVAPVELVGLARIEA